MNLGINAVCGRVNELLKRKSIEEVGDKIGKSGKKQALLKANKVIEVQE